MGLQYRPVDIRVGSIRFHTVGLIDTGADETVISERLARTMKCSFRGDFEARSASRGMVRGKYTQVTSMEEKWSGKSVERYRIGVSDDPFADDEGIEVIIGVDFLQDEAESALRVRDSAHIVKLKTSTFIELFTVDNIQIMS